jgi:HPt (histidine-containing phosphotransfer) domain-containing protein
MIPVHTLHDMAVDLGADVARDFADLYLTALEGRIDRLRCAIASSDTAEAHAAAVSLYSASWMVGAHELADAAYAVAESARSSDLEGMRSGLPPVEACIDSSVADIRLALSELGSVGIRHRAPSR